MGTGGSLELSRHEVGRSCHGKPWGEENLWAWFSVRGGIHKTVIGLSDVNYVPGITFLDSPSKLYDLNRCITSISQI